MDTPPLLYKSVHVTFVFWVPKTPPPPPPYMSGTFVLAPPRPRILCPPENRETILHRFYSNTVKLRTPAPRIPCPLPNTLPFCFTREALM